MPCSGSFESWQWLTTMLTTRRRGYVGCPLQLPATGVLYRKGEPVPSAETDGRELTTTSVHAAEDP